ncbi:hypothetical protein D3C78_1220530 [compost metagenome]
MQGHGHQAARRRAAGAADAGGQHQNAPRTQRHRIGDRRVAGHAAVHQQPAAALDGGEYQRNGAAGQQRRLGRAPGKQHALAAEQVGAEHMQRQLRLLQQAYRQHPADQPAQGLAMQEVAALVQQRRRGIAQGEGKHVGLAQAAPDRGQLGQPRRRRPGGEVGAVDRADRGAEHQVDGHPLLDQRLQHADLHGAETAAADQHQCGIHGAHAPRLPCRADPSSRPVRLVG